MSWYTAGIIPLEEKQKAFLHVGVIKNVIPINYQWLNQPFVMKLNGPIYIHS